MFTMIPDDIGYKVLGLSAPDIQSVKRKTVLLYLNDSCAHSFRWHLRVLVADRADEFLLGSLVNALNKQTRSRCIPYPS